MDVRNMETAEMHENTAQIIPRVYVPFCGQADEAMFSICAAES